jgi:hypothetical protein
MLVLAAALLNAQPGSLAGMPNPHKLLSPYSPFLLAWRVLLYAGIATLWWKVDQLQTNPAARSQWRRLGVVCGLLILAIEITRGEQA